MTFKIHEAVAILSRTPIIISALLDGISDEWLMNDEGENTWSPYEILGHLIHGEKTDWIPRATIILSEKADKTFIPFDRFAQLNEQNKKPIHDLIEHFKALRKENLQTLHSFNLDAQDLLKKGIHPELGSVNLTQLLSTWVVHDLGHLSQMTRVMAKQYKNEVGVWHAYLGILQS